MRKGRGTESAGNRLLGWLLRLLSGRTIAPWLTVQGSENLANGGEGVGGH